MSEKCCLEVLNFGRLGVNGRELAATFINNGGQKVANGQTTISYINITGKKKISN